MTSSCANLWLKQTNTSGIIFSTKINHGVYDNNMYCQWTLSSNVKLELTFFIFSTQLGADYLHVYDGGSSFSSLIGTFSGTTLPSPITSSSNKLHVRFTSDSSGIARGFRASYRGLFIIIVTSHSTNRINRVII